MQRILSIFLLCFLLSPVWPVQAQGAVQVTDIHVSFAFGEQVTFQSHMAASTPIQQVVILFRAQGESNTHTAQAQIQGDGQVTYRYTFDEGPIRPFAPVIFWYRVTFQGGQEVTTAQYSFNYIDNRFPWQTLEDNHIHLHWYAGDLSFGQEAFDAAQAGLQEGQQILPGSLPTAPIDVYIYATPADLQSALSLGGQMLVDGEASPDLGVALVAISPGDEQGVDMDREIPHELAHILTYDRVGSRYDQLPTWLQEGIASVAERSPNPDYPTALSMAVQNGTLIPLNDLCDSFPVDMSGVFLAYAESESFTRYLIDKFGASGLESLLQAYANGLDCQSGAAQALGQPLDQLENNWRSQVLGENRGLRGLVNLLPYLLILAVVLLPPLWLGLRFRKESDDDSPKPK